MDPAESQSRHRRALVEQLERSQLYQDYSKAFREATGLPLALRAVDAFTLPHGGRPNENPLCAMLGGSNASCSLCLQHQQKVETQSMDEPQTIQCHAGLSDSAVPVKLGDGVLAYLETGQIMLHEPSKREFNKLLKMAQPWGLPTDVAKLEEAYFSTRVLSKAQYDSILRLLAIFAQHLSSLINQLIVKESKAEPPQIMKARNFIAEHLTEDLSLKDVAQAVNMSSFYFCKMFKHATGLTFTDHLARMRIERVKESLLNPHRRISEAAFEAGFQSLSQFNRVFRKIAGESPTRYRRRIHPGLAD